MTNEDQGTLDDILDQSIDDLADAPTFDAWPAGSYRAAVKFEEKKINNIQSVEMKLTYRETLELSNPNSDDTPIKADATTSMLFMMRTKDGEVNEMGQGTLKKAIAQLKESGAQGDTSRQIMQYCNDMEVILTMNKKERKENGKGTGVYNNQIINIALV